MSKKTKQKKSELKEVRGGFNHTVIRLRVGWSKKKINKNTIAWCARDAVQDSQHALPARSIHHPLTTQFPSNLTRDWREKKIIKKKNKVSRRLQRTAVIPAAIRSHFLSALEAGGPLMEARVATWHTSACSKTTFTDQIWARDLSWLCRWSGFECLNSFPVFCLHFAPLGVVRRTRVPPSGQIHDSVLFLTASSSSSFQWLFCSSWSHNEKFCCWTTQKATQQP